MLYIKKLALVFISTSVTCFRILKVIKVQIKGSGKKSHLIFSVIFNYFCHLQLR